MNDAGQPDSKLASSRIQIRHDEDALIVRGANLIIAVCCDNGASFCDDVAAAVRFCEAKARAARDHIIRHPRVVG